MSRTGSVSRKWAVFAVSVATSALLFGASGAEGRTPRRTYGAISLENQGKVARHFDVSIFQTRRNRRERLAESASVWISAGGDFSWNRAIVGKSYRVQVTSLPDGNVIHDDASEVDAEGATSSIPILANPGEEDPRDAQIAALNTQIAGLESQVSDLQAQVLALQNELAGCIQPLAGERDATFATPTVSAGALRVQIAQFTLEASAVQAVTISRLKFDKDLDKAADLENLYVEIDGVMFGKRRGGVGDSQAGMDFNGLFTVPAGGVATVSIYCDIEPSATAHTALTLIDLIGWIANGQSTGVSIPFPGPVTGQDVIFTN